jgi:hypothetical protein
LVPRLELKAIELPLPRIIGNYQLFNAMQLQNRTYSPEEYLQLEEQAEYKSEYHDGEIIPMTGGTTNHNEISLNLVTNLRFSLNVFTLLTCVYGYLVIVCIPILMSC